MYMYVCTCTYVQFISQSLADIRGLRISAGRERRGGEGRGEEGRGGEGRGGERRGGEGRGGEGRGGEGRGGEGRGGEGRGGGTVAHTLCMVCSVRHSHTLSNVTLYMTRTF